MGKSKRRQPRSSAAAGAAASSAATEQTGPPLAEIQEEILRAVGDHGDIEIPSDEAGLRQMYAQLLDERDTPRETDEVHEDAVDEDPGDQVEAAEPVFPGAEVLSPPAVPSAGLRPRTQGKHRASRSSTSASSGRAGGQGGHGVKKPKRKQSRRNARSQRIGRARQAGQESRLSSSLALESEEEEEAEGSLEDLRGLLAARPPARSSKNFIATRDREALERDAEVAANTAAVEPVLERIYPGAGQNPLGHKFPLPVKERILPAAVAEYMAAGRTMEGEVRYQLEAIKRSPGVKIGAVKDQEPMLTQAAIAIDMEIRERGLPAITAPGLEVLYRVMYSTMAQLSNQSSPAVARRTEAYPVNKAGLFIPRAVRREAILAEKRETAKE